MADAIFAAYSEHEEKEKLLSESRALKLELENKLRPTEIIGNCSNMKKVYSMISKVAASNATVIIRGESGTGNGTCRQGYPEKSLRQDNPFIVVNCAAASGGTNRKRIVRPREGLVYGRRE